MIQNIHHRDFTQTPVEVGQLIDTLASKQDRLWPRDRWPAMRFDRSLEVGARGGHSPIHYTIERYTPASEIVFRFHKPAGFNGTHGYFVTSLANGLTRLEHRLEMTTSGPALLTWPLIFRPLHDALIEDSLDKAEKHLTGALAQASRWTPWVKFLRWMIAGRSARANTDKRQTT